MPLVACARSLTERVVLGVHLPGAKQRAQVRSGREPDRDADVADRLVRVSVLDGLERRVRTGTTVVVIPPRPRGRDPRVERTLRDIGIGRLRVREKIASCASFSRKTRRYGTPTPPVLLSAVYRATKARCFTSLNGWPFIEFVQIDPPSAPPSAYGPNFTPSGEFLTVSLVALNPFVGRPPVTRIGMAFWTSFFRSPLGIEPALDVVAGDQLGRDCGRRAAEQQGHDDGGDRAARPTVDLR